MKCAKCGQVLNAKAKFCPICGTAAPTEKTKPVPQVIITARPMAFDIETAGQMMGVSAGTVRNLIKKGLLAFSEPTDGRKVITAWEIERYLKARERMVGNVETQVLKMQ